MVSVLPAPAERVYPPDPGEGRPEMKWWIPVLTIAIAASVRAADAPKVPDKPDANGFEVTIKSVKLNYVKLKKKTGELFKEGDDAVSQDKVLIFTLTITNRGQKEQT
jgi:hypothetical protein